MNLIVKKSHISTKVDLVGLPCTPMIHGDGKYRQLHKNIFNFSVNTMLQMLKMYFLYSLLLSYLHDNHSGHRGVFYSPLQLPFSLQYILGKLCTSYA